MQFTRGTKEIRRVVVTGIGAVTPVGLSFEESWHNLLAGKSGIGPITKFDAAKFDTRFAGEVKGFNPDAYIPKKEQKRMDTFIQYAVACTKMALEQSKLQMTPELAPRTGTMIGSGIGGLPVIEEQHNKYLEKGPGRISPFFIPAVITNMASGQVSIEHGFKGVNFSIASACATGAHTIGESFNSIRFGFHDVMIAGGTEATICPLAVCGFGAMKALSTRNDSPETASRPFDQSRDGFVLAEGGAVLVLESLEHAMNRGAPILCEVVGYGNSSDAYHMTSPAPEGAGAAQSIERALKDAGMRPEQIQYVNAHATSTPMGDELENMAIARVFGEHAKKLLVGATKSMTGHALGAAGAIEAAICIGALRDQKVPPTINLKNPSESCNLDYVRDHAREVRIDHVLKNSFGFGGTNVSLIFSRFQE